MLYFIENENDSFAFEKWAKENNISFNCLDEGCYVDICPCCGEREYWHYGSCGNCGFNL